MCVTARLFKNRQVLVKTWLVCPAKKVVEIPRILTIRETILNFLFAGRFHSWAEQDISGLYIFFAS